MDVIVMDIPGIKGESQLKNFTEKIELLTFSHGVAMQITGDVSNTERTSGRRNHQDFTATKYMDKASPLLNQACCKGAIPGTVKVTVGRNDRGAVLPIMLYELENAVLSSVSVGGGSGDKPVETITLNDSKITWTFNAQKASGHVRAEQTAVGRLIAEPPYCSKAEVDRSGCQFPGLKVDAVAKHHCPIERQSGLRTVPFDELIHSVAISTLSVRGTEAIQYGRFGLIEIRESQDLLRNSPILS